MAQKPLEYWIQFGPHALPVRVISGQESLSRPFRFEVVFAVDRAMDFDPDEWIGAAATIVIGRDRLERRIDGLVTDLSIGAVTRGAADVAMIVEPRIALARHRIDIRIFRERTVPEIVAQVLSGLGIELELRLREHYATRPYCVQMRETDLDFVSRLLEDEGIFY